MNLKRSFVIAVVMAIVLLLLWEFYWRSQGYFPTIDDNKDLWAVQRAKVEKLSDDDIVLIGSSRIHFDLQLDEFEKAIGKRPIQLAIPGSSPLPILHDIVENTEFKGTILVGVTPGLFFSTTFPKAPPWNRSASKVKHYHERTYAGRLNHSLSVPLQKNLVLMSGHEEEGDENIDIKSLLKRIKLSPRKSSPSYPPFLEFGDSDLDRNVRMMEQCEKDTTYANVIKAAWKFLLERDLPPPDKDGTTAYFNKDIQKFKARGGEVILIRFPSSGMFDSGEKRFLPRERFFDSLAQVTNLRSYHYEDYPQLKDIECCPEWSHLSAPAADLFTAELSKLFLQDGVFTPSKTQE